MRMNFVARLILANIVIIKKAIPIPIVLSASFAARLLDACVHQCFVK